MHVQITVSIDAVEAHLAHGDLYPVPSGGCPGGTPRTQSNPFADVHPGDYFYDRALNLYDRGVLGGYPDGTFRPYNGATRAQLVKIVVLAFGIILDPDSPQHFTDVPRGSPFFIYIEAGFREGLLNGYADGTFRPNNPVTRGQAAKIVVQASGYQTATPLEPTFVDVSVGSAFFTYVETAYANGMLAGYPDGTFRPGEPTTRGQVSKVTDLATHP